MLLRRRRLWPLALGPLLPARVWAHHGWGSFDQSRPLYLAGTASKVQWRNPHVAFDLKVAPDLALPADLKQRALPAQAAPVDGPALLARAALPTRRDAVWHIELAPLTRMEAWQVPRLSEGSELALVGFTFAEEKGDAVLRVEYLFVGGKAYGLRSAPA